MKDVVQEIKEKLDIVDIVSLYVNLKKVGRNYKGLSPFKKENTPSFLVSPDKQIAYCFSTQKGGDIFSFIQEVENVDFRGALEFLAQKAGITLEEHPSPGRRKSQSDIEEYRKITEKAVQFFVEHAVEAQDYFEKRRISEESKIKFQLGYAPKEKQLLFTLLTKNGEHSAAHIEKIGLVTNHQGVYHDKLKDRIIFPLKNALGLPVGFAGRILESGEPKYINSPESPIYDKSSLLYGLHLAKDPIREQGYAIVVEGYMDVIMSHQHGVTNVVATAGTALTEAQVHLLKRYTSTVYFLFDNDTAGIEATFRNAALLAKYDMRLSILSLDSFGVKDIDEFFALYSKEEFSTVLSSKQTFITYALAHLMKKDVSTVEAKINVIHTLLPYLHALTNHIEKDDAYTTIAQTLNLRYEVVKAEVERHVKRKVHEPTVQEKSKITFSLPSLLFGIFLLEPKMNMYFAEMLHLITPQTDFEIFLKKHLLTFLSFYEDNHQEQFRIPEGEFQKEMELLFLYIEDHNMIESEEVTAKVITHKFEQYRIKETERLASEMRSLEKSGDFAGWKQHFDLIQHLKKWS